MLDVKICGIAGDSALDAAVRHGARWAGFVFHPPSPRHVTLAQAAALIRQLPPRVGAVAVLVDPGADFVDALLRAAPFAALQFHGAEPPDRLTRHAADRIEVWKAVPVRTTSDLAAANGWAGVADRIVYDAKPPEGASLPGGLGLRFDWRLLDGWQHRRPWLLSGGLDANNLAEAVGITAARAVDVSSGVERAAGVKDVDKIAVFLKAASDL